ncbi:hypothetical protein niasHS_013158 [Heterodera schachtii]|uniref:Calcium homeostasis endoplasmic reticulum protein n=1 Tax=Heterodera schachtii TaxID=97005 RepID=A0ABD2IAM0_HETSC
MSSAVPCPPADTELRDSIEKFAAYVARNGPASEEVSRQQHRDNPKFAFLFAGEGSDFYKYRLLYEIQNLRQSATVPFMSPPPVGMQGPPPFVPNQQTHEMEIQRIEEQIKSLRNQITESESNLKAHELALNSQKQAKVEALWTAKEDKRIADLIKQVGLNIAAFEKLIDRLHDSGSKETISNSKKWIFDNCNSDRLREIILTYLLHRVRERRSSDAFRLHVLYLINDWAHYCQRKKLDSIRQMLSRYVPKLYAYACSSPMAASNNTFVDKLEKLVGVWEGHKYFDDGCYKQLRNPSATMLAEQTATVAEQHQLAAEVDKEIVDTLGAYTKQHKEYEQHVLTKVAEREKALRECREKAENERKRLAAEREKAEQMRRRSTRFDQTIPLPSTNSPHKIPSLLEINPPPHSPAVHQQPCLGNGPSSMGPSFPPLPPTAAPPPMAHFAPPQQRPPVDLIPKAPYYELPAGMMVPLIGIEDITYESLREKDLRLPPPEAPSDQLMREIDRFYIALQPPPPVDCVRDADGWEVNGLLEYYIKKREQKVKLEAELKEKGKTFEDAITNKYVPPQPTKKSEPKKSKSRSPPSSSSSASSSSSTSGGESSSESSSRSRSRSRSRSSSRSRSTSPLNQKSQSPTFKRRRRSRTRSPTPEDRPSFGGFAAPIKTTPRSAVSFKMPALPLNRETNKGAQLMAKMGWEGKGLGAKEQGIEEPVGGGEVRDKMEQFRGLGSKPDIYEEYRKQKSVQMAKKLGKF